jgi:hypothetical protein
MYFGGSLRHLHGQAPRLAHCPEKAGCESKTYGIDEGTKMVLVLCHLFEDIGASHLSALTPILYSDNQGGCLSPF